MLSCSRASAGRVRGSRREAGRILPREIAGQVKRRWGRAAAAGRHPRRRWPAAEAAAAAG